MTATLPGDAGVSEFAPPPWDDTDLDQSPKTGTGERAFVFVWLERVYRRDQLGKLQNGDAALKVAAAVASNADANGTGIFTATETWAGGLGVSVRTVERGLACLTRNGYLETVKRGYGGFGGSGASKSSVRRLTLPSPHAAPAASGGYANSDAAAARGGYADHAAAKSNQAAAKQVHAAAASGGLPTPSIPTPVVPTPIATSSRELSKWERDELAAQALSFYDEQSGGEGDEPLRSETRQQRADRQRAERQARSAQPEPHKWSWARRND